MAHWDDPAWLAEVDGWVAAAVRATGSELTGDRDQSHDRPWSTAIAYPTAAGRVWFKANAPGTAHEPALVALLSRLVPDLVPEVVAVDPARAWSLSRDAGPMARALVGPGELARVLRRELPRYAEAQLALAPHVPELLATGVLDRSPPRLPALLAELLAELGSLPEADGGLGPERLRAVEARYAAYPSWCAQLEAGGVPATVQHDDLHSGNLCLPGPDGPARVIDWGDASVSHPFSTLLVTLGAVAHAAGVPVEDPVVDGVREAYLEPFAAYGTPAWLREQVRLARLTGVVVRAASWRAALLGQPPEVHRDLGFPVRAWLEDDD